MKYILIIISLFVSIVSYCQNIIVTPIQINTKADEFAPSYYEDGLSIVSNRKNSVVKSVVRLDENGREHFLNDLYFLTPDDTLDLSEHFKIKSFDYNEPELHEGPSVFNRSYNHMILSKTIKSKNNRQPDRVGLFYSNRKNGIWDVPKPLSFQTSVNNYSQPFLNYNEDKLYFVSDIPGGQGGMDIWYLSKIGGEWSDPINMGAKVNSSKNEIFPYCIGDKMFFSSDKLKNGYDIYSVDLSRNEAAERLNEPLNSKFDDYGLITKDFGKSGYFSSNRNGNDDIFKFEMDVFFPDTCIGSMRIPRCYLFVDDDPVSDTLPYLNKWDFGDGTVSTNQSERHCFQNSGTFLVSLSLQDTVYNNEIKNVATYAIEIEEQTQPFIESFQNDSGLIFAGIYDESFNVIQNNTLWKVEDQLFNNNYLALSYKISGNYELQAFNTNVEDSLCYKSIVWVDTENDNFIKLIPNSYDRLVNKGLKKWLKLQVFDNKSDKIILRNSESEINIHNDWVWKLSNYIKNNYQVTLTIEVDNKIDHFIMIAE